MVCTIARMRKIMDDENTAADTTTGSLDSHESGGFGVDHAAVMAALAGLNESDGADVDDVESDGAGEDLEADTESADEAVTSSAQPPISPVPYQRFAESRRELAATKAELAAATARAQIMESQMMQIMQHLQGLQNQQGLQQHESVEDDLIDPFEQELQSLRKETQELRKWREEQAFEAAKNQQLSKMQSEWDRAKAKFPLVEQLGAAGLVFDLLAAQSDLSVEAATQRVNTYLSAAAGGAQKKTTQTPAARPAGSARPPVPRPPARGGQVMGGAYKRPSTISEASESALAFLSRLNSGQN